MVNLPRIEDEHWAEYGSAKRIPRRDLFEFIRRPMHVAALYPLDLDRHLPANLRWMASWLDLIFELFLYFVAVHLAALYVCTIYLSYGGGNLELLVNCLMQAIIYLWLIAIKLYFRRWQGRNLRDLLNFINFKYATCSAKGFTYVTMDESLAMSRLWCKVYIYSGFGFGFWLLLPLAYRDRSLPLTCWYPFDYKKPIVYELMYFLQMVGQLQVAATFASSSGLHMVLAILISGQYDVLNCSIKNLLATTYIDLGRSNEELLQLEALQEQQSVSDAEVNQYYCSTERKCEWQRFQPSRSEVGALRSVVNFGAACRKALRHCVEQHRFIVNALHRMEDFYHPIWFFKTGQVTLLMCLVAFVSQKSTEDSSFFKMISLGQYLVLVAWEMLIICYFGEMISLNSASCGEALLRSPWHLHAPEMKSDILIFLLNARNCFNLTAGKFFILNVECFRSIMTTAFSFMTLLQQMDERT